MEAAFAFSTFPPATPLTALLGFWTALAALPVAPLLTVLAAPLVDLAKGLADLGLAGTFFAAALAGAFPAGLAAPLAILGAGAGVLDDLAPALGAAAGALAFGAAAAGAGFFLGSALAAPAAAGAAFFSSLGKDESGLHV